jgi:hypothetical protein
MTCQVTRNSLMARWPACALSGPASQHVKPAKPLPNLVPTRESVARQGRLCNLVVRACMSIAQNSFRTERGHWVHPRCAADWDNQRDQRATN